MADGVRDSRVDLIARIDDRSATVGVVGLGYVGLPVACTFAKAGFRVIGVDRDAARVADVAAGRNPIEGVEPGLAELLADVVRSGRLTATEDARALREADVITVSVETPVDDDHRPRYEALRAACHSIGSSLRRGALVIVESTITPGTIDRIVRPILEKESGLRAGTDYSVGHCPERVMPGRLLANLRAMSRVCGGDTPETAAVMASFYRTVVEGELDETDCVTAELVKTAENAYRDVNIAFANEVALICEDVGGDVWRVRELVNKSPGRLMLMPGAGVGGHCIPKDPWLLAASASDGAPARLIPAARAVNDSMPDHVRDLVEALLRDAGRTLSSAKIAVLGYAYLEASDDTRNSPSAVLVRSLRAAGAQVAIHDPYVRDFAGSVEAAANGADAIVVMVRHPEYGRLDLRSLRRVVRTPLLIDARAMLDEHAANAAGFTYRRLGKGS